jgi:hypothetical protein
VDERVACFAPARVVLDQCGLHRFLERVQQVVLVQPAKSRQKVEAERLPGQRRDRQNLAAVITTGRVSDHDQADAARRGVGDRTSVRH